MFQVLAWLLLSATVSLSLVYPDYRVVTIFPQPVEHFSIFLPTGFAFGLGYPHRYLILTVALIFFTAAVEVAQFWVPGRHARLSDLIINLLGLGAGIGLAWIMTRWRKAGTRTGRTG